MAEIRVTQEVEKATLHPGTDVVAVHVPALREQLRKLVAQGARDLAVDLQGVQMVDSAGIGLLVSAHNSLQKCGGRLAVIHASRDIFELLRAMRMHQHFAVSAE